ncbi:MAG: hypothetical protein OXG24_00580 [Gammaproteobacteria bacterium]|nr:hypothetical protein [Gammaproteobacteria bacterium]
MEGLLSNIGKLLNSDSPIAAWKFSNWLLILWVWPFIPLMVIAGKSFFGFVVISIVVSIAIVLIVCFVLLRRTIIAKGILKSELDAISKTIGRAAVASALVAMLVLITLYFAIELSLKSLGIWDSVDQANIVTKFAVSYAMIVLPGYIGWKLSGRRVYSKRLSELST